MQSHFINGRWYRDVEAGDTLSGHFTDCTISMYEGSAMGDCELYNCTIIAYADFKIGDAIIDNCKWEVR